jgi:hypothetical protein
MWFGAVKLGKAYVSFHLMPLYMSPTLEKEISPSLKKRMARPALLPIREPARQSRQEFF